MALLSHDWCTALTQASPLSSSRCAWCDSMGHVCSCKGRASPPAWYHRLLMFIVIQTMGTEHECKMIPPFIGFTGGLYSL